MSVAEPTKISNPDDAELIGKAALRKASWRMTYHPHQALTPDPPAAAQSPAPAA